MNNSYPKTGALCIGCNKAMFISYTPNGADYETCPICGDGTYDCIDNDKYDRMISFCNKCQTIFMISDCVHAVNGCTDNAYYSKLVHKFKYEGKDYDGMPKFKSFSDCEKELDKYELTWVCMCNRNCPECPEAYYKDKYKCKDKCYCSS
jgi:hypothetical protein